MAETRCEGDLTRNGLVADAPLALPCRVLGYSSSVTPLVFHATQFYVGRIGTRTPAPDFVEKEDLMTVKTSIGDIAADRLPSLWLLVWNARW